MMMNDEKCEGQTAGWIGGQPHPERQEEERAVHSVRPSATKKAKKGQQARPRTRAPCPHTKLLVRASKLLAPAAVRAAVQTNFSGASVVYILLSLVLQPNHAKNHTQNRTVPHADAAPAAVGCAGPRLQSRCARPAPAKQVRAAIALYIHFAFSLYAL